MTRLLVIDETAVRELLDLDELAAALERALIALSAGQASVPARVAAAAPAGLLGAMPGHVPGMGLGAKLVSVFPQNQAPVPSHQAVIVAFTEDTGTPFALLDATYITGVRTAMTAAVAARRLARADSRVLAIVGAGVQGENHLHAFTRLFALDDIRVASRNALHAERVAGLHPSARAVSSFEEAVTGADIVACCTDASEPIISDEWIAPGSHVSSVGSGREIPAATVDRAHVVVESPAALLAPPAGTAELQGRDPSSVTEIGAVLAGTARGRLDAAQVTLYKSMGHAVEDLAAVSVVLAAAGRRSDLPTVTL